MILNEPGVEGGGPVSRTVLTQFGRALKQLGIEHIAAYSPQGLTGHFYRKFSGAT